MTELQTELTQLTAVGTEPITVAEAKLWMKVDFSDDDALIGALITGARSYAEMVCRRSFLSGETWRLTINRFPFPLLSGTPYVDRPYSELYGNEAEYIFNRPTAFAIEIPMGPVTAITSISYTAPDGTTEVLDPSKYDLVQGDDINPRIYPTFGNYWPATQFLPDGVRILFTAGSGIIPGYVRVAMKQIIAHWYANREAVSTTGSVPQTVPLTADVLLAPYRLLEF